LRAVRKPLLQQRWPWLVAAGAIVLAFLSTVVEIGPPADWDDRPVGSAEDIARLPERDDLNVLFILIDTLRADRLGSYGYERDTSPVLDRLAHSGVRFARTLAQSSWTKCSMASLWTGLNPARTGVTRFDDVLPDAARMPAEILREAGFHTVGLYRNGWVAPTFGFDQGFAEYKRPVPIPIPPGVRLENPTVSDKSTDESAIEAALEFLRIDGRERWFLYLHLMDVHEYLYDEQTAVFGSSYSDVYDNAILRNDGVIGLLLVSLAELDLLENTLVVIASDHGEAFRERGFEGHARQVYKESTEVPFLLSFPFRLEPGVVVETRARNVDVWPTVLDLLGLALPGTDGRSLVPRILASARGEPAADDGEPAVAHLDQTWARKDAVSLPTVAVAQGPLRYVRVLPVRGPAFEQLFDARDDPAELRDRAGDDPETLARLAALADAYLAEEPSWGEAPTREIDELELNHLRALGYAIP
jgi:arylsulfatase A-like enzyme